MFICSKMTRDKTMNKQYEAQRALTAASKKERKKNTQTNRQTMTTASETALHKTSKINLRN